MILFSKFKKATPWLLLILFSSGCFSYKNNQQTDRNRTKEKDLYQSSLLKSDLIARFNRIHSPEAQGYLKEIQRRVSMTKTPSPEIIILNTDTNLAFTDSKDIYLSKGLIVSLESEAEFLGLIAHEYYHINYPQDKEEEVNNEILADNYALSIIRKNNLDIDSYLDLTVKICRVELEFDTNAENDCYIRIDNINKQILNSTLPKRRFMPEREFKKFKLKISAQ